MPHVTTRSQQCESSSCNIEKKNNSWSSEIYRFMVRNATPNRSEAAACEKSRSSVDQKTFFARLGLTVSQPDENTPLLTETSLTRSPIRSQICRGMSQITMRNLADVDFSSRLGQLLMHQLNASTTLNNNAAVMAEMKQERYFDGIDNNGRMPQLRTRAQIEYPITYTVDKRSKKCNNHTYCFNSKQRKERVKTIASGLNKSSRMLKRLCKPCRVILQRVKVDLKQTTQNPLSKLANSQTVNNSKCKEQPKPSKQLIYNSMCKQLPHQQPMKQLDITQMFKKQKNAASSASLGKEIIIDGNVVIDLCSDDEGEDVIVKPKSLASSSNSVNGIEVVNNNDNVNSSSEIVKLLDCKVALRDVFDSIVKAPDGQMYICNTQTELNATRKMKCSPDNINLLDNVGERSCGLDVDADSHKSRGESCNDENHRLGRRNASTAFPKPKLTTPVKLAKQSSKKNYTRCKKLTTTSFVVQFKCHMCNYIGYIGHALLKEKIDKHVSFYHGGYQNIIMVRRISQNTGHIIIELKSEFDAANRLHDASS